MAACLISAILEIIERPDKKPEDGVYTDGLYVEGARMGDDLKLAESLPKVLFAPMCIVLLKPAPKDNISHYSNYNCPVYRTTARKGVLATTGHSSNFVMFMRVPTTETKAHWVVRGCALVNSLPE